MEQIYKVFGSRYLLCRRTYDDELFGHPVHELVEFFDDANEVERDETALSEDLESLKLCTFRGLHNLPMFHFLEANEFRYIDDFLEVTCQRQQFQPLKLSPNINIQVIKGEPQSKIGDAILKITASVFDFSTFVADYRIPKNISKKRNCIRVGSYFKKEGHHVFLISTGSKESESDIVGFFQFEISGNKAIGVNGAVSPDAQNIFFGPFLYSYACDYIFRNNDDIKSITCGLGAGNTAVLNIFQKLNFKISKRETHFRKYLPTL